jgi:hypothetical protein
MAHSSSLGGDFGARLTLKTTATLSPPALRVTVDGASHAGSVWFDDGARSF